MNKMSTGKKGRRGTPESWSVDSHVGARIRTRRMLLGISQSKLGEALGLTFQQVQKYEHGVNRVTAGMLYQLSQALDVPVSFFFDCYESADTADSSGAGAPTTTVETPGGGPITRQEARMLRLWRQAPAPIAHEMLALMSTMSPKATITDLELDDDDMNSRLV